MNSCENENIQFWRIIIQLSAIEQVEQLQNDKTNNEKNIKKSERQT